MSKQQHGSDRLDGKALEVLNASSSARSALTMGDLELALLSDTQAWGEKKVDS